MELEIFGVGGDRIFVSGCLTDFFDSLCLSVKCFLIPKGLNLRSESELNKHSLDLSQKSSWKNSKGIKETHSFHIPQTRIPRPHKFPSMRIFSFSLLPLFTPPTNKQPRTQSRRSHQRCHTVSRPSSLTPFSFLTSSNPPSMKLHSF